jgi:hypothetical protein
VGPGGTPKFDNAAEFDDELLIFLDGVEVIIQRSH